VPASEEFDCLPRSSRFPCYVKLSAKKRERVCQTIANSRTHKPKLLLRQSGALLGPNRECAAIQPLRVILAGSGGAWVQQAASIIGPPPAAGFAEACAGQVLRSGRRQQARQLRASMPCLPSSARPTAWRGGSGWACVPSAAGRSSSNWRLVTRAACQGVREQRYRQGHRRQPQAWIAPI
jgi:hypothetical protein